MTAVAMVTASRRTVVLAVTLLLAVLILVIATSAPHLSSGALKHQVHCSTTTAAETEPSQAVTLPGRSHDRRTAEASGIPQSLESDESNENSPPSGNGSAASETRGFYVTSDGVQGLVVCPDGCCKDIERITLTLIHKDGTLGAPLTPNISLLSDDQLAWSAHLRDGSYSMDIFPAGINYRIVVQDQACTPASVLIGGLYSYEIHVVGANGSPLPVPDLAWSSLSRYSNWIGIESDDAGSGRFVSRDFAVRVLAAKPGYAPKTQQVRAGINTIALEEELGFQIVLVEGDVDIPWPREYSKVLAIGPDGRSYPNFGGAFYVLVPGKYRVELPKLGFTQANTAEVLVTQPGILRHTIAVAGASR